MLPSLEPLLLRERLAGLPPLADEPREASCREQTQVGPWLWVSFFGFMSGAAGALFWLG